MLFPTGIFSDHHFAEGQFDVVRRSNSRLDTKHWIEQPMYDFPAHHFILQDGNDAHFALFNNGLKEYEILPDKQTVALTLFRAFTHTIQPSSLERYDHQDGSQCLGTQTYEIGIFVGAGNVNLKTVYKHALLFSYPPIAFQHGRPTGKIPPRYGFLSISNETLIWSAFKQSEDDKGFILRFYNPTERQLTSSIRFSNSPKRISEVTLEEIPIEDLKIQDRSVELIVRKKQIISLKVIFLSL
jgi:alpha-mannosidase